MATKYIPVLKWKQGERKALRELSPNIKDKIQPVVNVMKDPDPQKIVKEIAQVWGIKRGFYLDFHPTCNIAPNLFLDSILHDAVGQTLNILPVISLTTQENYFDVIKDNICSFTHGVAIRLELGDISYAEKLRQKLVDEIQAPAESIDMLIDLAILPRFASSMVSSVAGTIDNAIRSLKQLSKWRTITLVGSSFPDALKVRQDEITTLPRVEWAIFQEVIKNHPEIRFGDYGVDDPDDPSFDHFVTIIPTIRYTTGKCWLVVRGHVNPYVRNDFRQFHTLSQQTQAHPDFLGATYSWGDQMITECAQTQCLGSRGCNHGGMTSWVSRNTNHHLTFVAHQASK